MEKTLNPFNNTFKRTTIVGVVAAQLLAASASAAELSPLVVTAGRMAENPANVSASVSVITHQDIIASQANSVADLLRSQTGLDVASNGGAGKNTSVFIRGGNSGHTLVLIDGVRVGSATTGSFDWGNFPVADIERIEIVRGPQSSLYGADAMAGVIQIFTRRGQKGLHGHASVEAGSFGSVNANESISGGTDAGVTYAFSVDSLQTDGFSAAANGSEADGYKRTTISGRLGFELGAASVDVSLRNVDGKADLDGYDPLTWAFGDVLNYTSHYKQNVSSVKVAYPFSETFETTVQLSRSTDDSVSSDPVTAGNNGDFKTTIDQLTIQNNWDLSAGSLLFGVDSHKDSGLSQSAGLDKAVSQQAAFASLAWSLGKADLNGSLRLDNNSVSSNQKTYKAGGVVHIVDGLNLSANYGTGFKAPSLNDLYYPLDSWGSVGNANLNPETSKSWDAGLSYQMQGQATFTLTWFKQRYNDLIVWAMDPITFGFSPANVDRATSKGLEFTADWRHEAGFFHANWTKLNASNDSSGLLLARRAKESGSFTLGTDVADLHAELQLNVVGKRYSDAKNKVVLDSYKKSDLRLSYALNQDWKVKFRVENIENKKYEEVSGYGVAGRATYAGVSATF